MKLIVAIAACLLFSGASFAQNTTKPAASGSTKIHRTAIGGVIKNSRKQPVPKVQAYIYKNDTIMASGFSGADGYYETNSVTPGVYALRLVYPASGRRINVTGVPIKSLKVTQVNIMSEEPTGDTTIAYTDLYPKPAAKKK